ncbi:MAG: hypothetical protein EA369_09475 [Bradymonadales bacterium]|nr:MAG: hypothetical protein EA369_09475 [Bradymonadales bacterium]
MLKILLLFLLTTALSACGMRYASHQELIQAYKGQSIEDVIVLWGAPTSMSQLPSGNFVYGFETEKTEMRKTAEIRGSNSEGSELYQQVSIKCRKTVTADPQGIICGS